LSVLGNGDAAAAEFEAPRAGGVEEFLPARPPPPPRITPPEAASLGLPAGTPRAIADIWTEVRSLEPADRQTLASEFPQLKSIINPESNDPPPSTTAEDLAKVAATGGASISRRVDELRDNRFLSEYHDEITKVIDDQRRIALSLVSKAVNDIPTDLILTPKILKRFLIERINTLTGSDTKAADDPRYIFEIFSCKLILPRERRITSNAKVRLGGVKLGAIVNRLILLGVGAGVLCTTVTDCAKKVAEAKSYLNEHLENDEQIDVISKGGKEASLYQHNAALDALRRNHAAEARIRAAKDQAYYLKQLSIRPLW
jgi:hypothetical protein